MPPDPSIQCSFHNAGLHKQETLIVTANINKVATVGICLYAI